MQQKSVKKPLRSRTVCLPQTVFMLGERKTLCMSTREIKKKKEYKHTQAKHTRGASKHGDLKKNAFKHRKKPLYTEL